MALLTDEQSEEVILLCKEALDAMDVMQATMTVIKRRLQKVEADLTLQRT
jgi:hypothetical protein